MKSKNIVLLIIAAVCVMQAASAYEDAMIRVELSSQYVSPGDTFTANITVDPVDNEVFCAGYILSFDKAMVNVISQTEGNFLSQDGAGTYVVTNAHDNSIGEAEYEETRWGGVDYGVTTPGTLTSITFEFTGNAQEPGSLNFDYTMMGGNSIADPINVTTYNATFNVEPPEPFLIYGHVFYEDGTPCNNPFVNITNLKTCEEWEAKTSDSSNYYQIMLTSGIDLNASEILRFNVTDGANCNITDHTITAGEVDDGGLFDFNLTIASLKIGDVNGDGEITPTDAAIALQMAVRGEYSDIADVSGDNSVTSLDALMIQQAAINNVSL